MVLKEETQEPNNFCLHFAFFILDGLFQLNPAKQSKVTIAKPLNKKKHYAKKA
jgi:hypothetical protein